MDVWAIVKALVVALIALIGTAMFLLRVLADEDRRPDGKETPRSVRGVFIVLGGSFVLATFVFSLNAFL